MKKSEGKKRPAKRQSPTHFVALQIKNQEIHDAVQEVQKKIETHHEKYKTALVSHKKSHFTVIVFAINDDTDMENAKCNLDVAALKIKEIYDKPLSLHIRGLDHFGNKVLFASVEKNEMLTKIADIVKETFATNGLYTMEAGKKEEYNPHMTVMKLSRDKHLYRRGIKNIHPSVWTDDKDRDFGEEQVLHLQLCSMVDETDADGYYHVCHISSFLGDEPPKQPNESQKDPKTDIEKLAAESEKDPKTEIEKPAAESEKDPKTEKPAAELEKDPKTEIEKPAAELEKDP